MIAVWNPKALTPAELEKDLLELAGVLYATVHAGGSVSFILPFSIQDSVGFWRDKVLPGVLAGTRHVLVARPDDGGGAVIRGTVQADFATPQNQAHRAELAKLLVHPSARRHGLARALMIEVESLIRRSGRTLITMDTVTGGDAERLYLSMGYKAAGAIPGYARKALTPELESTTVLYKTL